MADIEEAILKDPCFTPRCFVGFSGGADSTALLLALHHIGFTGTAVHFNHHLRGEEADRDARWCQRFCEERHIDFKVIDLDGQSLTAAPGGIENAARQARLHSWEAMGASKEFPVALAHHGDDAIEELLLRLARGGNCSSLTALRSWRILSNGVALWRPLLGFRKQDLEAYLRQNGLFDWCHDATNQEDGCRRNILRNSILPALCRNFGDLSGIQASLAALREDAHFLEQSARQSIEYLRRPGATLSDWRAIAPALFPRVLRGFFDLPYPPNRQSILQLRATIASWSGGERRCALDSRTDVVIGRHGLRLSPTRTDGTQCWLIRWNWKCEPRKSLPDGRVVTAQFCSSYPGVHEADAEFFAPCVLPEVVEIRTWQDGDAMMPFGLDGHHRKLKAIFNENRIYGNERLNYPLLCSGDDILWVAPLRRSAIGGVRKNAPCIKISLLSEDSGMEH